MDITLFKESVRKFVELPDEKADAVVAKSTRKTFRKGQFLLHADAAVQKTFFIESGLAVAYFVSPDGEEHLIQFGFSGWWISDIHSFLYGVPAKLNIRALEDTVVYEFTYEQREAAFAEIPQLQSYFLIITQNAFASFQQRTLNNLSLSAEERYLDFCAKYPDINLKLSQKWIASYLGFSPEFLSRLKRKLLNK